MSKPDDNLISFTGDQAGNIWRNGVHLFGPDVPAHDVPRNQRVVELSHLAELFDAAETSGRTIADTLKFSGVRGLTVIVRGVVPGGTEDCIDFNNECEDLVIEALEGLQPQGKYAITGKGGSRRVTIIGPILGPAEVVEIDLGNWSDQSRLRTREIVLTTPAAGWAGPVRWRRLNATTPTLQGGRYRRVRGSVPGELRRLFLNIFTLFKKLFR